LSKIDGGARNSGSLACKSMKTQFQSKRRSFWIASCCAKSTRCRNRAHTDAQLCLLPRHR